MNKRYYPANIGFKKAGENRVFAVNKNDGMTHLISVYEGELFSKLSGSKTLQKHFEIIMESDMYETASSVLTEIIKKWIQKGFLRDEKLLLRQTNQKEMTVKQDLISGCITCNRPSMLNRWLETRIENNDYISRKSKIAICDDTDISEMKLLNMNIISKFRKNYPERIFYIDYTEKKKLAKQITESVHETLPDGIVDFSMSLIGNNLYSKRTGGNRNSLLLATAGSNLYSSDDDIEYRYFSKTDSENRKIYNFTENYSSPYYFHPDIKTMITTYGLKEKFSLLETFEDQTGRRVSHLPKNMLSESLKNIPSSTSMLLEKNRLWIRAVTAGYCGGRWYQNPYLPLLQEASDRRTFFNNHDKYKIIKNIGLNIISPDNIILDHGDFFMGGSFCLNNSIIAPPCLPFGRREDTNLGILLNRCLESGLTMHLPVALYHNPAVKNSFQPENFLDVSIDTGVYSTLIIEKLTSSFIQPHGKERLKELGFRFQEFGELKIEDFEEQLKLIQLGFLSKAMNHISYLLDLYEREPVWWAEDMERYYSLLENEALGKDTAVPRELRSYRTKKEALTVFKKYLFKCGEMLQWWPEIWEAAKNLNEEKKGLLDI